MLVGGANSRHQDLKSLIASGARWNGVYADWKPWFSFGKPMEGDGVHSRPWLRILQAFPTPVRWLGKEFVSLIHWIDHTAARATAGARTSPAFFFVATIGTLGVGLTIGLFVSVIEQTSKQNSRSFHPTTTVIHGRNSLEKNYEWSAQDRWRVAHMFVPHKPPAQLKDIQLDTRFFTLNSEVGRAFDQSSTSRSTTAGRMLVTKDVDVRLDLSRPKRAQQGRRFVAGTNADTEFDRDRPSVPRIQKRNSRFLVQASWEFAKDCNQNDYVSLPIRRPIAVPDPEPDTIPLPVRRPTPDLDFSMSMIRHFTNSAFFPPGSHLVTKSDRSVFVMDERWLQNELASFSREWRRTHHTGHLMSDDAIPYAGVGVFDPISRIRHELAEADQSIPASADVEFRLEMYAPDTVAGGHSNQSRLIVRNEGRDSIQGVEVQELISDLQTVVAASPNGVIEDVSDPTTGQRTRVLHRETQQLMPGDGNEFSLKWIPEGGRHQFHRARVIAHADVFAAANVVRPTPNQPMTSIPAELPVEKHPALACDVQYLDKAVVGDKIELEITVRNTGDTSLHDVQVRINIPDQFSHPEGKVVLFNAGNLPVSGQNQTIIKMSALQAGDAVNSLEVASAENVAAKGDTRILVVERPKRANQLPPLPEVVTSKSKLVPVPATKNPVTKPLANGQCCCQRSPIVQSNLGFEFYDSQ